MLPFFFKENKVDKSSNIKLINLNNWLQQNTDVRSVVNNNNKIDLDFLINLGYNIGKNNFNNAFINQERLWLLAPFLQELNQMIGMKKLKENIIDLVLYCVQDLYDTSLKSTDNLHTILCGPPGVGKTTVAHILANIYCHLGYIPTNNVICAKKSDFIGKFVGHTEPKTQELLDKAKGGVLFIDEAYALGGGNDPDTFSKTIINMLNAHLSEHKHEFVCIIAGYEKELEEGFFSINPGLKRRFPWKFVIDKYSPEELFEVMKCLSHRIGWNLDTKINNNFFNDKMSNFPHFGGDIEVYINHCKNSYSRRLFSNAISNNIDANNEKKILTLEDLKTGYESYIQHKPQNNISQYHNFMYM